MRRNPRTVGEDSKWAHSDRARAEEILFVAARQTHIYAGCEPEVFPLVHLVFAAEHHVSDPSGRSRTGKSAIETRRCCAACNNGRIKRVEGGIAGPEGILHDGG